MRPEKHRQRSYGAAVSRGRMFLKARLAWLPGFPVVAEAGKGEVLWVCMRQREQVLLTREHLHDATYTWSKLTRHYVHVLPKLVDEVEAWVEGLPQLLEWLKGIVHRGEPLPLSLFEMEEQQHGFSHHAIEQAHVLGQREAALRPLLGALSWYLYLTPSLLPQALSWVEENAAVLRVILGQRSTTKGLMAALMLWQLAYRDGNRRVKPLLCWLASQDHFNLCIADQVSYIEAELKKQKKKKNLAKGIELSQARSTIGDRIVAFVAWVASQEKAIGRRALDLFAVLLSDELPTAWLGWWKQIHPLLEQTKGGLSLTETSQQVEQRVENAYKSIEQLIKDAPPRPYFKKLIALIRKAAHHRAFCEEAIPTLKQLPLVQGQILVRAAFFQHWVRRVESKPHQTIIFLTAFRPFLAQHRHHTGLLHPWQNVLDHWNHSMQLGSWCLGHDLDPDNQISARQMLPIFFDALAQCAYKFDKPLAHKHGELILSLVCHTNESNLAQNYFFELMKINPNKCYFSEDILRCAHLLSQREASFAPLVYALDKAEQQEYNVGKMMLLVEKHFAHSGWVNLTRDLILDGEWKALCIVAQEITALQALQQDVKLPAPPSTDTLPTWCQRYPTDFVPSLAVLLAMKTDAKPIVARILDKQYPNPARVEQEIVVIQDLLNKEPDNHKLAKRLENLRARLAAPVPVSPARFARLQAKLQRAARHAVFQCWREQLDEALHRQICQVLGLEQMPEWFFEPRQLRVLSALFTLPTAFRELGLRLLHRRCGSPPWTLIDEPANQAFIEQVERQGIILAPWLNPPQSRLYTGKNGRKVYLEFEDDPLEIFQMGEHFNTCLSIGASNFFSVFANVADINKHVIYARDKQKRVVGRCLLALTKEGYLLTFADYCHDPELGFDEMVASAIQELATKIGTAIVLRGDVPSLVAPDWYDDGPIDLCNRFAFLEAKSAFRRSLKNIEASRLVNLLTTNFHPLPLNAYTLTLILALNEFETRPELILPLLLFVEQYKEELSDHMLLHTAYLSHQAGASDFAYRVIRQRALPYLLKFHRQQGHLPTHFMVLLITLQPSVGLQILRRTRARGIRTDYDETHPTRLTLFAQAYDVLGRHAGAERLHKKANYVTR